ncbi:retrovirus-related pol polyprotein from transposon TNT 1-94 [Tanacetum coccineum]
MKVEESLNVTFDESPSPTKLSPLVDDDVGEEEAIENNIKVVNNNNIKDESVEVDGAVNIKESKNNPLKQVIGNLNQRILVAQGYNQQEGIDYNKTYISVARLEYIQILLAIACANEFKLYLMYVKSAFLNGFINEEVYVAQPLGFIDFEKPNYVYKLKKALYGLKKAPKSWCDRLKAFLQKPKYSMGMVDNSLSTKKSKLHLIIVQIYVDDIIFGSTCQNLCDGFIKIMHDEFETSMMGELNFFLGLQIKQMEDGIFSNQSKYIKEMLKKFGLEDSKPIKTLMLAEIKLTKDEEADSVDSTKYRDHFAKLTSLPNQGICLYYDAWSLDQLERTLEKIPPYNLTLPSLEDIRNEIHRRATIEDHLFDERYILVPRKMPSLKAKQPKKPPPKKTRNIGKYKRAQLTSTSSSELASSDNRDLPSTKLFLRSYSKALAAHANMSDDQRETRGMFKNLGRELHNFTRQLKKGCR